MARQVKQSLLSGALTLMIATIIVKIIGAVFKIPISNILTSQGYGYFNTAYSIYLPIFTLANAGLPSAVSRMVAEQNSLDNPQNSRRVLSLSIRFFLVSGTIGMVAMFFIPDIVALLPQQFQDMAPESALAVKTLAPTLLFVCIMSAFRGYNEGHQDMFPTAISQLIEALGKLVFGLLLANFAISNGLKSFENGLPVYGKICTTEAEATSACLPYAAAGAIAGVTIGAFCGMVFLLVRNRVRRKAMAPQADMPARPATPDSVLFKRLIKLALPICLAAIALNMNSWIDRTTLFININGILEKAPGYLEGVFQNIMEYGKITSDKLANELWGIYGLALTFYNLVPMITSGFGVSALPAITSCVSKNDVKGLNQNIERAIRIPALLAYPAAMGLAVLAKPILTLFHFNNYGAGGVELASQMLQVLSITLIFASLATPMGSVLQGLGRPDLQVKIVAGGVGLKLLTNFFLIGIPEINVLGAPIGTLVLFAFVFFFELYMICSKSRVKLPFSQTFFKPLACALICGFTAWGSYRLCFDIIGMRNMFALAISIVFAAIIYVLALFITKAIKKEDILSLKNGKKIAQILEKYRLIG